MTLRKPSSQSQPRKAPSRLGSSREFEALIQAIFAGILTDDLLKPIEFQRNVTLPGKTTMHEIDVHWHFTLGGIAHEGIIQAKNWVKPVDQGEVLKFKAVLEDLPGRPLGLMVSRRGFQAGARGAAAANGILLFTAAPQPRAHIRMTTTSVSFLRVTYDPVTHVESKPGSLQVVRKRTAIVHHEVWTAEGIEMKFRLPSQQIRPGEREPSKLYFVSVGGSVRFRLSALVQDCLKYAQGTGVEQWAWTRLLDPATDLEDESGTVLAKGVRAVSIAFRIHRAEKVSSVMGAPGVVNYVLHDLLTGNKKVVRITLGEPEIPPG